MKTMSKRTWDHTVKEWRRNLHHWDTGRRHHPLSATNGTTSTPSQCGRRFLFHPPCIALVFFVHKPYQW